MHGHEAVGQIDANFAQGSEFEQLTFTLGARAWRAKHLDWSRALLHVEPIEAGGLPRWQGQPVLLGRALCEAIRDVLVTKDEPELWSTRARKQLAQIRAEHEFLDANGITLTSDTAGFRLWTFFGGKANNLLAKTLESKLGGKVCNNNLSIAFREEAGKSEIAIRRALDELRAEGRPNHDDAVRFAELCARGRLTKFEACLPDRLLSEFMAEELTEEANASEPRSNPE